MSKHVIILHTGEVKRVTITGEAARDEKLRQQILQMILQQELERLAREARQREARDAQRRKELEAVRPPPRAPYAYDGREGMRCEH